MLVEWNANLRSGLHAWLVQEFPGYRVKTAAHREQAEQLAAACLPTLVLVNIDAHQGEGFATLRSLREQQPEVLLIALSLYPVTYFREAATAAGAAGCACIALADDRLRDLLRELLPSWQNRVPAETDCAS